MDKNESIQNKKTEKLISGKASIRKNSEAKKLAKILYPNNGTSLKSEIIGDIYEILIPTVKRSVSDILSNIIDAVLFPDGKEGKDYNRVKARRSYDKMYRGGSYRQSEKNLERRYRYSTGFDYEPIAFENRGDAEAVLYGMDDVIDQFGVVSVGDMYDMAEISTPNHMVNKFGWSDIRDAKVVRVRDEFIIKLPDPRPLDVN